MILFETIQFFIDETNLNLEGEFIRSMLNIYRHMKKAFKQDLTNQTLSMTKLLLRRPGEIQVNIPKFSHYSKLKRN